MSHVDFMKCQCCVSLSPVEFRKCPMSLLHVSQCCCRKGSCRPVEFKNWPCRLVDFKSRAIQKDLSVNNRTDVHPNPTCPPPRAGPALPKARLHIPYHAQIFLDLPMSLSNRGGSIGALDGGSPMSHVEFKKWLCPLSLF